MNKHQKGIANRRSTITGILLLLLFFSKIANAELSEIDPGFPRFIANKTNIDYSHAGGSTYFFNAYNVNPGVYWRESNSLLKERVELEPAFVAQVGIDASNPSNPQVLANSFFEVYGNLPSFGTGNTLLFSADIKDLFWRSGRGGIIEFVLDGTSMAGSACTLGYCSFADEVLQFKVKASFSGDWGNEFFQTATSVATIPLPAAAWLFGSALLGLSGVKIRKQRA